MEIYPNVYDYYADTIYRQFSPAGIGGAGGVDVYVTGP